MGDGVWDRHDGLEPEDAVGIAPHDDPAVRALSIGVLHVVEAFAVRLPNVDFDVFYRVAGRVLDGAKNQAWLPVRIVRDGAAVYLVLGLERVEWSEDGAFCAGRRLWVIDAYRPTNSTGVQS